MRTLAFLLSALMSLPALAEEKTILHVALVDGLAFTQRQVEVLDDFLKIHFPGHSHITVSVNADNWVRREAAIREEIRVALEGIPQDALITHMTISAHGGTKTEENGDTLTEIKHLGSISEKGVDGDFDEVFAPIRNRFSKDASIILNSCSTLEGDETPAIERAQTLLAYFGATDGRLYGATEPEFDAILTASDMRRPKDFLVGWRFLRMILPAAFMIGAVGMADFHLASESGLKSVEYARDTLLATATLSASLYLLASTYKAISVLGAEKLEALNRGRLLVFIKGKIHKVSLIRHVPKYWKPIYGINSCQSVLKQ